MPMPMPMPVTEVKPIELDPRLDVNKALDYVPFKEIDTSTLPPLPDKWADELIKLCISDLPMAEQDKLRESFNAKLKDDIDYKFKDDMRLGVEKIYRRLIGQLDKALGALSDSEKSSIIVKLNEGVGQCPPGFHNRVGEILLSFQLPKNLQQVLFKVRMNLVKKMAHRLSDEVHAHNRCFMIARGLGYGVQPMNEKDIYRGGLDDNNIKAELKTVFASEYHAYQLPFLLCEELRGIFGNFGYEPGQPLKPETYINIQNYLMPLFCCDEGSTTEVSSLKFSGKEEIDEDGSKKKETESQAIGSKSLDTDKLFLTDEETDDVHDINTEYLSKLLYQALRKQGVIRNEMKDLKDENSSIALAYYFRLGAIDESIEKAKRILAKAAETKEIKRLANELCALTTKEHAEYFKELSATKEFQNFLTSAKVEENLPEAVKAFVNYDPSKDDIKAIGARVVTYLKLALLLKNDASFDMSIVSYCGKNGVNVLMIAVRYHPEAVQPILDFMSKHAKELGDLQKKIFLQTTKNGVNVLICAVAGHPDAVRSILDFMSKHAKELGGECLQQVFSQTTKNDVNVLMCAVNGHPDAVRSILGFMSKHAEELGGESLQKILSQTDNNGFKVLMSAAVWHPEAVQLILDFVFKHLEKLGAECLQKIFLNINLGALRRFLQPLELTIALRRFSQPLELKIQEFYNNFDSKRIDNNPEKFYVLEKCYIVTAKAAMGRDKFCDIFIKATKDRGDWGKHFDRALNPATIVGGFFATHRGFPIGETRSQENIRKVYRANLDVINSAREVQGSRMKI